MGRRCITPEDAEVYHVLERSPKMGVPSPPWRVARIHSGPLHPAPPCRTALSKSELCEVESVPIPIVNLVRAPCRTRTQWPSVPSLAANIGPPLSKLVRIWLAKLRRTSRSLAGPICNFI